MPPDENIPKDRPDPGDRKRLEHILQSARDAIVVVGTDDASSITTDMVRTRALVNCFTEIGEAAARVSAAGRARASAIPWRQFVGLRHIVVHVYWGIDVAQLVASAQDDLPDLIASLESALRDWPTE